MRGGRIEFGILGEPATLDPYGRLASDLTYALVGPVFPMPYRMLPDGTTAPDLADSLEVSGDSARLTLAKRRWSSGKMISAQDVVASIERARAPSGFAAIRAAHAVGPRVVQMRGEFEDWEITLSQGSFVLPRGRLMRGSISGGPFRFSRYVRGRSISYAPNPLADEAPHLDSLKVNFVAGTDLLIRLVQTGELDAASIPSTVNLSDRLNELGIAFDSGTGSERIVLAFDSGRVSLDSARATVAEIDRDRLVESFVRDEGSPLGSLPKSNSDALPGDLSIAAPEGDELLGLIQRALQLDLRAAIPTVELITAPVSTVYGPWLRGGPPDSLLLRVAGPAAGNDGYSFPLATVATFVAWRDEVHGIVVNPSLEGPLWNAAQWWKEPSI